MRKLITTSLVAVGLLGLAACTKTPAASNAADTSLDAGNTTVDEGALGGNDVTAVDDGSAFGNGSGGNLSDGNAADVAGNATDAGGNSQ